MLSAAEDIERGLVTKEMAWRQFQVLAAAQQVFEQPKDASVKAAHKKDD